MISVKTGSECKELNGSIFSRESCGSLLFSLLNSLLFPCCLLLLLLQIFFFFSERILQERDRNDVDRNVKCSKKVNTSVAARWFYWE